MKPSTNMHWSKELLAAPEKAVEFNQNGSGVIFTLPHQASNPVASVMCLELSGK